MLRAGSHSRLRPSKYLRQSKGMSGFALASLLVVLPRIFSDHIVLQRASAVPVWGKAGPGEVVTVKLEGDDCSRRCSAIRPARTDGETLMMVQCSYSYRRRRRCAAKKGTAARQSSATDGSGTTVMVTLSR